jgi:hypothetical protein
MMSNGDNKWYCSELVYWAYYNAKFDLDPTFSAGERYNPFCGYISPCDIIKGGHVDLLWRYKEGGFDCGSSVASNI